MNRRFLVVKRSVFIASVRRSFAVCILRKARAQTLYHDVNLRHNTWQQNQNKIIKPPLGENKNLSNLENRKAVGRLGQEGGFLEKETSIGIREAPHFIGAIQ